MNDGKGCGPGRRLQTEVAVQVEMREGSYQQ